MSFLYGAAEGADITVGTTTVTGGTTTRVLYDNAGVLGEYTVSGSGSVAMTVSPTFTGTPLAPTATGGTSTTQIATTAFVATGFLPLSGGTLTGGLTVALGTITADAQNFSGTATWNNAGVTFTADKINITDTASNAASLLWDRQVAGVSKGKLDKSGNLTATGAAVFGTTGTFGSNIQITSTGTDTGLLNGSTAGTIGMVAGASFVYAAANTSYLAMRGNTYAGNANQRGNIYIGAGNPSTPGAAEGSINFVTGADVARLTLTALGSVVLGSAAIATNATDGFLYAVSGAGTPTGAPTAFTGRVPIYVDTTNAQLWMYLGGAWKQPKTPAGAAIVTWQ